MAHQLGAFITAERQRRSWTRKRLADEIRRSAYQMDEVATTAAQTVKGWERFGIRPQPEALRWLARTFDVPVDRLVALADGAAGNLLAEEEQETERRDFLTLLAAGSLGMVDLERLATPAVDALYVRDAEELTTVLLGQWYGAAPGVLLPPVLAHLASLQRALPGPLELEVVTGRTALLAGHLLIKLQLTGQARTCYALAESLARDSRNEDLEVAELICRSALHDWRQGRNPRRSAELVDAAAAMVNSSTSRHLQVWVLARRAEERAAAGDVDGFQRDMAAAETALTPSGDHWYGPRDAAELAAFRGACELLLGRYRDAADTLAWTLQRMSPTAANWRAVVADDRERALAAL